MRIALVGMLLVPALACGKKKGSALNASPYGLSPETAAYEVQCITPQTVIPAMPSGATGDPIMAAPLPDNLPAAHVPVEVGSCPALPGGAPHFYNKEMTAFTASVDCNAKVVRFKSHDWQVTESAAIGPTGGIDANIMLITRLVSDAAGNSNCWTRLLGRVTGHATCGPGGPMDAHIDLHVDWKLDETPPEIMETPPPGLADLRNGKHCTVAPGNCMFSNSASLGCGG